MLTPSRDQAQTEFRDAPLAVVITSTCLRAENTSFDFKFPGSSIDSGVV